MKDQIHHWLDHPDYEEGVMLYRKYGKDQALLSLFLLPETSFTFSKLKNALTDLIKETPEAEVKPKTPQPILDLIRKRSQLHESLFHTKGKEDRHLIAKTILAIGRKLDRYYDDGQLPDDQAENENKSDHIPTNAWELHMMINNNTAYLAKNKKREDKQGEVQRRIRQNGNIEERLKEMNHGAIS
jgi:hypothetical protein